MNRRDLTRCANDPAFFRSQLLIDADGVPTPFKPDAWQDADFRALDPGWLRSAGRGKAKPGGKLRAWLERPRGHSKSADLACMVTWILLFAARPVKGIAAAGDRDQAGLLRDAIRTLCRLNPWIGSVLEVDNWKITNAKTGAELEVISSDAATSYGALVDFAVADERTHWRSDDLWISLLSTVAKRKNVMFVCISNAGFTESESWKVREKIRTDSAWHFSRLDGPVASWISRECLAEQERLLPSVAYRRLWLNEWTSGAGDALTEQDVQASVVLDGPAAAPDPGTDYFAGADLGLRRDRAAVAVVGVNRQNVASLVYLKTWQPGKREIDLSAVEGELRRLSSAWRTRSILCDQWQAAQLVQNLQRDGLHAESIAYTSAVLTEVATIAIERFRDRSIQLWRDEQLIRDLTRLRIEERPGGFRLVSPRGADGHGDSVSALLLALLAAKREPVRPPLVMPFIILMKRDSLAPPDTSTHGYFGVEYLPPFECFAAILGNGKVVRELKSAEESAYLVNLAARRAGLPAPNRLQAEIGDERLRELEAML